MLLAAVCSACLIGLASAATTGGHDVAVPPKTTGGGVLKPMLHIEWRRLPDFPKQGTKAYPSGLEAASGGWVDDDTVISAFGYASGGKTAFINSAWLLNITSSKGWQRLPDAPVPGRQGAGAAVVGGAVYFVGGFSYNAPYTYSDVLKLQRQSNGAWGWSKLPPFPHPITAYSSLVAVGTKLYSVGGAYYTADVKAEAGFYVNQTGKQLWSLDTAAPAAGWTRLQDLPSTARWVHSVSAVGSKIIVIGGARSNVGTPTTSLIDN